MQRASRSLKLQLQPAGSLPLPSPAHRLCFTYLFCKSAAGLPTPNCSYSPPSQPSSSTSEASRDGHQHATAFRSHVVPLHPETKLPVPLNCISLPPPSHSSCCISAHPLLLDSRKETYAHVKCQPAPRSTAGDTIGV